MKIGSIGYATNQGIGILMKQFYDNGVITHVSTIRHKVHKTQDWYPPLGWRELINQVDLLFIIEKPYDWKMATYARSKGVPCVIMPMYECTPHPMPMTPAGLILPSLLDKDIYIKDCPILQEHIPVPVSVPWRQRTHALKFIHNAGHLGLKNRNGTSLLIDAMRLVKSPIQLLLRSQEPLPWSTPHNVTVIGEVPYESLWGEGDVFVFPNKFGGLFLPLQEACASGMLVMATDIYPGNAYLHIGPLIPPRTTYLDSLNKKRGYRNIEMHSLSPQEIADTMDHWYGKDISSFSLYGNQYAQNNSWEKLKPKYMSFFQRVLNETPTRN